MTAGFGHDRVYVRICVAGEVGAHLLASQVVLALLRNETFLNEHHE